MRTIFLLFFGYLVYKFLIKPLFLNNPQKTQYRNPQTDMAEMLRRMQAFQQQQNQKHQQHGNNEYSNSNKSRPLDGEYIDYEEID